MKNRLDGSILSQIVLIFFSMGGLILSLAGFPLEFPPAARAGTPQTSATAKGDSAGKKPAPLHPLEGKIFRMIGAAATGNIQPVEFRDEEVNDYFESKGDRLLPKSVSEVDLAFKEDSVEGSALVDFDEVNRHRPADDDSMSGWLLSNIKGKKKVEYRLGVQSENGTAKVEIESAVFDGVELPSILVYFMVNRFLAKQYGVNIDGPMPLPYGIDRVEFKPERMQIHPGKPKPKTPAPVGKSQLTAPAH